MLMSERSLRPVIRGVLREGFGGVLADVEWVGAVSGFGEAGIFKGIIR